MSNRTYDAADYIIDDGRLAPGAVAGIRTSRVIAFLIDAVIIAILTFAVGVLVFFLGIITLGLGWMLYPILWPAVALVYSAFSLGGPHSATIGMRSQGIEGRFMDGSRLNPGIAAIHAVLFYFSVSVLTPLVLLVSLFTKDKRLLHDIVLGIVFVNRY